MVSTETRPGDIFAVRAVALLTQGDPLARANLDGTFFRVHYFREYFGDYMP